MKNDSYLHPLFTENDVRGVVFDLDGTLIDSAGDILQGMRMTLEQAGLGKVPDDYFPDNMHGTVEGILRAIVADMGWNAPADFTPLNKGYLANAAKLDLQHTRVYEGALEVLQACRAGGLPMGICTNKGHAGALTATRKFGIHDLFDFITGCDTWSQPKPSPVPLLETIRMLGLTPDQCLYFGDTSVDAECARAAGVRFVLHQAGYADPALAGLPAHFVFSDWNELLAQEHTA
ncbi:MAG: HAD-IA family hydrolase [Alcaligenaceae bacterium]|nr:HAD-IA family hydrolase [Alcaligenaceae bacterium]